MPRLSTLMVTALLTLVTSCTSTRATTEAPPKKAPVAVNERVATAEPTPLTPQIRPIFRGTADEVPILLHQFGQLAMKWTLLETGAAWSSRVEHHYKRVIDTLEAHGCLTTRV